MTEQQVLFFAILAVAFALYLTERIRNDVVSLLVVLALSVTKILEPEEALAGSNSGREYSSRGRGVRVSKAPFILSSRL